jgi:hypothetical protein
VNDRSHIQKNRVPPQNVDALILPVSREENGSSDNESFFGFISTKEASVQPLDVEELGLQNVNSLRSQVSFQDTPQPEYPCDERVHIQNNDGISKREGYSPLPESSIHSVFEEETIELNPAQGIRMSTETEPAVEEADEEKKRNHITSFNPGEYDGVSLIDATLRNLVSSEPFLSEDDLLFLMKNDEFIGKRITRKTLKKALKRTGLETSHKRFRSYMSG